MDIDSFYLAMSDDSLQSCAKNIGKIAHCLQEFLILT